MTKTVFQYNVAWRSGAIEIRDGGYLFAQQVKFYKNIAFNEAGAIFVTSYSWMNLDNCEFTRNTANYTSAIQIIQGSLKKNTTMKDCDFDRNSAISNTLLILHASVTIDSTRFNRNDALIKSKHVFVGFSKVTIRNSRFHGEVFANPYKTSIVDETQGGHIHVISDSQLHIRGTIFQNGVAKNGGTIYIEGNSTVDVEKCNFRSSMARFKGGAIYGTNFNRLSLTRDTELISNVAFDQADDIFIQNTDGLFNMTDITIDNYMAVQSIYAENVNVIMKSVTIRNVAMNPHKDLQLGAALQCYNCKGLDISRSNFQNLTARLGGAIYIQETPINKQINTTTPKYIISRTHFHNNTAYAGGALYLNNP